MNNKPKDSIFFKDVVDAMQNMEDIGGPELPEYIAIMKVLKNECEDRIHNAMHQLMKEKGKEYKPQTGIELNGPANIQMIIQMAMMDNTESHTEIQPELADKIVEQAKHIERYILAIKDHLDSSYVAMGEKTFEYVVKQAILLPMWYEITQESERFPTLKERSNVMENPIQHQARTGEGT